MSSLTQRTNLSAPISPRKSGLLFISTYKEVEKGAKPYSVLFHRENENKVKRFGSFEGFKLSLQPQLN